MPGFRALGARSGESGSLSARPIGLDGRSAAPCASRAQPVTDATSIADDLIPRPKAASSRPEADGLMASSI